MDRHPGRQTGGVFGSRQINRQSRMDFSHRLACRSDCVESTAAATMLNRPSDLNRLQASSSGGSTARPV